MKRSTRVVIGVVALLIIIAVIIALAVKGGGRDKTPEQTVEPSETPVVSAPAETDSGTEDGSKTTVDPSSNSDVVVTTYPSTETDVVTDEILNQILEEAGMSN